MFDPDGYLPVPHIVAWLASLGAEGKLPRRLGFTHPGDVADPLDLSPEDNARRLIGGKLAAGAITAAVRLDTSGHLLPVPAHYWGSAAAEGTMQSGVMDLDVIARAMSLGLVAGLFNAPVLLAHDQVAAALGFQVIPPEEPLTVEPEPLNAKRTAMRGRSYRMGDAPLVAEMRAGIEAGIDATPTDAARRVVQKATGRGKEDSKVKRLVALHNAKLRQSE